MRHLWEIFTLLVGIGIILAISKGFPQFGRALAFLVFNPVGLILTIGCITWIVLRRRPPSPDSTSNRD